MLVSSKKILSNTKNYAVGCFIVNSFVGIAAVVRACSKEKSPGIIAISEDFIEYYGPEIIVQFVKAYVKDLKQPIALAMDHASKLPLIKKAIAAGFTSIQVDGSNLSLEKNIAFTKKVVALAHKKGVSVEGEVGNEDGKEDKNLVGVLFTNSQHAITFAKKSGVDAVVISAGTSHGVSKFHGKVRLDYKMIEEVASGTKIPLVVHGASAISPSLLAKIRIYDGDVKDRIGLNDQSVKKAIELGIKKFDIQYDIELAFTGSIRETLKSTPSETSDYALLAPVEDFVEKTIRQKIRLFGSANKAR